MKSNAIKILLISFTLVLASCMPDSMTKFKEDPPKKQEVASSGGTVADPDPDFFVGNGVVCTNGNGDATTEAVGEDLVVAAPIALPFTSDTTFLTTPYSLDGTNDPNYEFILIADGVDELTDINDQKGVECHYADDSTTTDFDSAILGAKLSWAVSPALPSGLTEETTDGVFSITGTTEGFSEMTLYTITATNSDTALTENDQIEIAASTSLIASDNEPIAFYTQINGTQWAMQVADAASFIPNYVVVNELGAYATINFIDRDNNILYLTIGTPSGEEHEKYFSFEDNIDMTLPDTVSAPSYSQSLSTVDELYATLLVGDTLEGAGLDNTALHFKEDSGLVVTDATGTYDGLTPDDVELTEWVRCKHAPDISSLGTVQFLDGIPGASPLTNISSVTNWGAVNSDLVNGDSDYTATLNRNCEFTGSFTSPMNYTKITSTLYNYAGESATATLGLQAKASIRQPYPVTNSEVEEVDKNFYFHYRYRGTGSNKAKMVLTVKNAAAFDYKSPVLDENMISNGRGTSATITAIQNSQIFITLENNDSYAFVVGDKVDNSATYLAEESEITAVEYTFEVGFDPALSAASYFEPQLALKKSADKLNVDVAGTAVTPFGSAEFSPAFIEQVKIGGTLSILDNNGSIDSQTISAITLTPGSHSLTTTAFSGSGVLLGINKTAYIQPHDATEQGLMSYSISNFLGQATAAVCTSIGSTCQTTDLVLLGSLASRQISFKPGALLDDAQHGRISIDNTLTSTTSTQDFTILATDVEGNSASTTFSYSINAPPAGISLSRNLLLSVPSSSAFVIGSYISSNNGDPGLGIVKDVFPDQYSTYQMIDIQLISGSFLEDDDLDNRQTFDSQKTYIFTDGVIPYNVSVADTGPGTIDASLYQDRFGCSIPSNRKFIDGPATTWDDATTRGTVAYAWDIATSGSASALLPGAINKVFLQVEKGTVTDSTTFDYTDCAGAFAGVAHTIDEVISDHLLITHTNSPNYITGLNITSNDGADAGSGVIHEQVSTNTQAYIGQYYFAANALFLVDGGTQDISPTNPYSATAIAISATEMDHTFYLYRYEKASIQFNLEAGFVDGSTVEFLDYDGAAYCKDCTTTPCTSFTTRTSCLADSGTWFLTDTASFPTGLDANSTTGIISGIPLINADKEKFVVRVSTPYGTVEHEFELKVYDHFIVEHAVANKPDSYLMHQVGYGMASVPCRVTQEAIDTGIADVVDLTCILDAGESDLYYKGMNMVVQTGDDMCTAVRETPFYYYDWPYLQTSNAAGSLFKHTGDVTDPLCGTLPDLTTVSGAGTYLSDTGPNLTASDAGITSPKEMCASDFTPVGALTAGSDYSGLNPSGPNCDDGEATFTNISWVATPFECIDSNGSADPGSSTYVACFANWGTCADTNGASVDGTSCMGCGDADDCADCATYSECVADSGGDGDNVWTADGQHNDTAAPAGAIADATNEYDDIYNGVSGDYGCVGTANVGVDTEPCGGSKGSCINGAGRSVLPATSLEGRETLAHIMSTGVTKVETKYDAPIDMDTSNLYLANYMSRLTCDDAANEYDFNWSTAGASNDWIDYSGEDPSGASHPFAGGYNYYGYTCDGGAGTIARVRLLVRDWDNPFSVTDGIEKIRLDGLTHPHDGGASTLLDDLTNTFCAFAPCDNRYSWDDYMDEPASTETCGNTNLLFDFANYGGAGVGDQRYPREKED